MLNWIRGFVDRWTGAVDARVRELVHWTVHALASVVYSVFGLVGKAWRNVWAAANWLRTTAEDFAAEVYAHIWAIVKRDLPWLAALITAARAYALRLYHVLLAWAAAEIRAAEQLARRLVDDVRSWAYRDIWLPLLHTAQALRRDLIHWGYTAWWYVTHPAALAGLLGDALVDWAEANAWRVARRLGTFTVAIVAHHTRQLLALAEDILTAVL